MIVVVFAFNDSTGTGGGGGGGSFDTKAKAIIVCAHVRSCVYVCAFAECALDGDREFTVIQPRPNL